MRAKSLSLAALVISFFSVGFNFTRQDEAEIPYVLHDSQGNLPTGATFWDVGAKLDQMVFAADFGVIPNDGNDDLQSLQRAVDYLGDKGGGVLLLPPGVIEITDVLFLNENAVVIKGVGIVDFESGYSNPPQGTVLKAIGSNWASWKTVLHVGKATSGSVLGTTFGVGLENLSIDGGGVAGLGVDIENVQHSYFKSLSISNMTDVGLRLRDSTDSNSPNKGTKYNVFSNIFIHARGGLSQSATGLELNYTLSSGGVFKNTFIGLRINHQTGHGIHIKGGDGNVFLSPFVWKNNGDVGHGLFIDPPTNVRAMNNHFFYPILSSVYASDKVTPPIRIWLYGLNFSSDNNGVYPISGNAHNLYVVLESGEYPGLGFPAERRQFIPANQLTVRGGNPTLQWVGQSGKEIQAYHLKKGDKLNGSFLYKKGEVSFGEPPKVFAWVKVLSQQSFGLTLSSGAFIHGSTGSPAQFRSEATIGDMGLNYATQKVFVGFLTDEIKKASATDPSDNDNRMVGFSLEVTSGPSGGGAFELLGIEIVKRGD
ncbi:MAG TPA: hypothetical protein ENK02_13850 [Planctomycetes bacterium]|nr:hypothetical protein [Planctomycetota bacterium]